MNGKRPGDSLVPAGGNGGGFFSTIGGWIRGGLATAAEKILGPIRRRITNTLSNDGIAGLASGAANKAIDNLVTWIRGKDSEATADGPDYTGVRGGFARPSRGPITSMFGPRWGAFHTGIDIAGGGPTYAAWNGRVARTGWNVLSGRTGIGILLNHGGGLQSYYGHNPVGGVRVSPGQEVKAGQRIGAQGATGRVTGIHLHWETLRNGKAVNPLPYLNRGRGGSGNEPRLYDNGGWLTPGIQTIVNATKRPEAILNSKQWDDISRLAMANSGESYGDIQVLIKPEDLEGLKNIEQFVTTVRRKARQR